MEEKLLLQNELNEYFTFVKKERRLETDFEIYCDDYGQSYVIVWLEDGKLQEFCCGTFNDWQGELEDIACYLQTKRKDRRK